MQNKKILSTLIIAILAFSMIFAFIPMASAETTIELVDPEDKVTPLISGPVGTEVLAKGTIDTAFGGVEIYWDGYTTKIGEGEADVNKDYEIEITIPEDIAGTHYVIVKDTIAGSSVNTPFDIESLIEIDPDRGLVGDTVTVDGTGFGEELLIAILFSNVTAPVGTTKADENIGTGDGGTTTFAKTLSKHPVKPGSVNVKYINDTITSELTDQGDGTLTGDGTGTINYVSGAISVDLTSAPDDNTLVNATYNYYTKVEGGLYLVHATGLKSSKLGSFSTTFKVPDVDTGNYTVIAFDAEGNEATETFAVGFYLILEPEKGSHGTEISVTGALSASSEITLEIGDIAKDYWYTLDTDPATIVSDSDGYFDATFEVPPLLWGPYTVRATDEEDETADADFEIAAPASITLKPTSGLQGKEVTVTGTDFSDEAEVTIYFGTILLETDPTTITTNGEGGFTATFEVPDVAKGSYTVKAEDEEGLSATDKFTVAERVTVIGPRRAGASPPVYRQGETVSFYVNSTVAFETDITLEIADPDGYPYGTLTLVTEELEDDGIYVVPYSGATFELPCDALLGDWEWTATYEMEGEEVEDTGVFTVAEMPYDAMLTKLDELDASLVSLDDDVATLSTNVGDVKVSVDDLGLKVVDITDGIATIETKVGTIEGKVTSIDSGVATIKTDIGTVKADVSTVKGYFPVTVAVDMTPAWIAVVLSLIAALAAIAAVITITRKIAG